MEITFESLLPSVFPFLDASTVFSLEKVNKMLKTALMNWLVSHNDILPIQYQKYRLFKLSELDNINPNLNSNTNEFVWGCIKKQKFNFKDRLIGTAILTKKNKPLLFIQPAVFSETMKQLTNKNLEIHTLGVKNLRKIAFNLGSIQISDYLNEVCDQLNNPKGKSWYRELSILNIIGPMLNQQQALIALSSVLPKLSDNKKIIRKIALKGFSVIVTKLSNDQVNTVILPMFNKNNLMHTTMLEALTMIASTFKIEKDLLLNWLEMLHLQNDVDYEINKVKLKFISTIISKLNPNDQKEVLKTQLLQLKKGNNEAKLQVLEKILFSADKVNFTPQEIMEILEKIHPKKINTIDFLSKEIAYILTLHAKKTPLFQSFQNEMRAILEKSNHLNIQKEISTIIGAVDTLYSADPITRRIGKRLFMLLIPALTPDQIAMYVAKIGGHWFLEKNYDEDWQILKVIAHKFNDTQINLILEKIISFSKFFSDSTRQTALKCFTMISFKLSNKQIADFLDKILLGVNNRSLVSNANTLATLLFRLSDEQVTYLLQKMLVILKKDKNRGDNFEEVLRGLKMILPRVAENEVATIFNQVVKLIPSSTMRERKEALNIMSMVAHRLTNNSLVTVFLATVFVNLSHPNAFIHNAARKACVTMAATIEKKYIPDLLQEIIVDLNKDKYHANAAILEILTAIAPKLTLEQSAMVLNEILGKLNNNSLRGYEKIENLISYLIVLGKLNVAQIEAIAMTVPGGINKPLLLNLVRGVVQIPTHLAQDFLVERYMCFKREDQLKRNDLFQELSSQRSNIQQHRFFNIRKNEQHTQKLQKSGLSTECRAVY